jgi:hypothetical protein
VTGIARGREMVRAPRLLGAAIALFTTIRAVAVLDGAPAFAIAGDGGTGRAARWAGRGR